MMLCPVKVWADPCGAKLPDWLGHFNVLGAEQHPGAGPKYDFDWGTGSSGSPAHW